MTIPILGQSPSPDDLRAQLLDELKTSATLHLTASRSAAHAIEAIERGDVDELLVANVERAAAAVSVAEVDDAVTLLLAPVLHELLSRRGQQGGTQP